MHDVCCQQAVQVLTIADGHRSKIVSESCCSTISISYAKECRMLSPATDPTAIYRYRDTLAAVDALAVAIIHLDLFTELSRCPADLNDLCARLKIHLRPADALCTLLLANQLLRRDTSGILYVTETAREFLVTGSTLNARAYYASMADKPGVSDFLRVLRTGRPANWPGLDGEADWHAAMRTREFAEAFTAAMDCRGRVLAPALAAAVNGNEIRRLLDIGGGSGVYSIAMAEQYPALQCTVLESPIVDEIAQRTIRAAHLSDRVDVLTADMFADEWPDGFDAHLFSNVLHDWDEAVCRQLLERSTSSLAENGCVFIHDMLLDDGKAGPLWAAEYSVLLTTVTQGRLYSAAEINSWLEDFGFRITDKSSTSLGRSVLTARRKK